MIPLVPNEISINRKILSTENFKWHHQTSLYNHKNHEQTHVSAEGLVVLVEDLLPHELVLVLEGEGLHGPGVRGRDQRPAVRTDVHREHLGAVVERPEREAEKQL